MRLFGIAAASALLMIGFGGCADRHRARGPSSADKCPALPISDPPFGDEKLLVLDFINNLAPAGSPLDLRPAARTDNPRNPGVCVDGLTGDIHVYGSKAKRVTVMLRFNPALSFNAIWPISPADALQVSFNPAGPWAPPKTPPSYFNPRTLQFVIDYAHGERPYYYRLQYVDPNDPDAKPHPIIGMISNH
jgi:hypothetical protein